MVYHPFVGSLFFFALSVADCQSDEVDGHRAEERYEVSQSYIHAGLMAIVLFNL